jgi:hypothetical protein
MKRLVVLTVLLTSPALAQQRPEPPSAEEVTAQYYVETGQLRAALGQAQAQIITMRKQLDEARAEAKKVKPDDKALPVPAESK